MQGKKIGGKPASASRSSESAGVASSKGKPATPETLTNKSKWSNGPPQSLQTTTTKRESAQKNDFDSDEISEFMRDRLLFLICNMIGSKVSVLLRGEGSDRYTGILGFLQAESKITLKYAQRVSPSGERVNALQSLEPLVLSLNEIRSLTAVGLDFNASERLVSTQASFKTDTDISKGSIGSAERPLTAWKPDSEAPPVSVALDSASHKEGEPWDQFEANRKLFGVTTDYKDELYTTTVDKSLPNYSAREKEAARIASEIEKQATSNPHLREERNQAAPSSGTTDEETKYSSVVRPDSTASAANLGGASAKRYVPQPVAKLMRENLLDADPSIVQASVGGSLAPMQKRNSSETISKPPNFAAVAAGHAAAKVPPPAATEGSQRVNSLKLSPALNKIGSKLGQAPASFGMKSTISTIANTAYHFREFANSQKAVFELQKAKVTKSEKADTISELRNFSKSLKLAQPMPSDLKELLNKEASNPATPANSTGNSKAKARAPEDGRTPYAATKDAPTPSSSDLTSKPKANPPVLADEKSDAVQPLKTGTPAKPVITQSASSSETAADLSKKKPGFQFNVNASAFEWKMTSTATDRPPSTGAMTQPLATRAMPPGPSNVMQIMPMLAPPIPRPPPVAAASVPPPMAIPVPAANLEIGSRSEFLRSFVASMVEFRRGQKRPASDEAGLNWKFGKYSVNALLEMAENGEAPAGYDTLRVPVGASSMVPSVPGGGYVEMSNGAPMLMSAPSYGVVYHTPGSVAFNPDPTLGSTSMSQVDASSITGTPTMAAPLITGPTGHVQTTPMHASSVGRGMFFNPAGQLDDSVVSSAGHMHPQPSVPGGVLYYSAGAPPPAPQVAHDPTRMRPMVPYELGAGAGGEAVVMATVAPNFGYVMPSEPASYYPRTVVSNPQFTGAIPAFGMIPRGFLPGEPQMMPKSNGRSYNRNGSSSSSPAFNGSELNGARAADAVEKNTYEKGSYGAVDSSKIAQPLGAQQYAAAIQRTTSSRQEIPNSASQLAFAVPQSAQVPVSHNRQYSGSGGGAGRGARERRSVSGTMSSSSSVSSGTGEIVHRQPSHRGRNGSYHQSQSIQGGGSANHASPNAGNFSRPSSASGNVPAAGRKYYQQSGNPHNASNPSNSSGGSRKRA